MVATLTTRYLGRGMEYGRDIRGCQCSEKGCQPPLYGDLVTYVVSVFSVCAKKYDSNASNGTVNFLASPLGLFSSFKKPSSLIVSL